MRVPAISLDERTEIRLTLAILLIAPLLWIGMSYYDDPSRGVSGEWQQQSQIPYADREPVVEPRRNMTVITGMDSPFKRTKAIYAFDQTGRLYYYDNSTVYGDVDPSPVGHRTVLTATHDYFRNQPDCQGKCTPQQIHRVNLTTGSHHVLYEYTTPGHHNTNWHDVDRLDEDQYLITGMRADSAWIVNTTTGLRTWQWDAQSSYPISGGGPFGSGQLPGAADDWVHLNDVEQLPDGRIMLSLRNQDQVVFIHPNGTLQESWTLGCDDCHDILFEQHNPDYIPPSQGGPAVLVADSENNRIVEYQRRNGEWVQSWVWTDDQMSWPRDADRLPNGHTLITDSHGNRVIEVNEAGEIVWQVRVVNGYDAERLGTGDESTGGPSARRAGLESHGAGEWESSTRRLANEREWTTEDHLTRWWHVAQFIFPVWVEFWDLPMAMMAGVIVAVRGGFEAYWRGWRVRLPVVNNE